MSDKKALRHYIQVNVDEKNQMWKILWAPKSNGFAAYMYENDPYGIGEAVFAVMAPNLPQLERGLKSFFINITDYDRESLLDTQKVWS